MPRTKIILPGIGKSMKTFVEEVGDRITELVEWTSAIIAATTSGSTGAIPAAPGTPTASATPPAASSASAPTAVPGPTTGGPTVTGTPAASPTITLGSGETIWDYAIKHGCWICARHGLTGKLQPIKQSEFFLTMKFHPMSAEAAITDFEKHVSLVTAYSIEKSINRSQAAALIASPDLKDRLYHITRFFEFPCRLAVGRQPLQFGTVVHQPMRRDATINRGQCFPGGGVTDFPRNLNIGNSM